MARYKSLTIRDNSVNKQDTVPTSPIVEGSTSTTPSKGMVIKSDGAGGLIANEILKEANCIYDNTDKTKYTSLSTSNASTTYTIYDLINKNKLTYKGGSQTASTSVPSTDSIFVPGIFLYDKNTKRLFFVKDLNTIIPIIV